MLSRNLEKSLHKALTLANERNHEYATLEHLLLAADRRSGGRRRDAGRATCASTVCVSS